MKIINYPSYNIVLKWYILVCVAVYVPFYHISKTMIELFVVLCIPYFFNFRKSINNYDVKIYLALFIILFNSVVFFITYKIAGDAKDLEFFWNFLRVILPCFLIYLFVSSEKSIALVEFVLALSLSLLFTFFMVIGDWFNSDFSGRVTLGTNLLLAYGAVLAAMLTMVFFSVHGFFNRKKYLFLLVFSLALGALALIASNAKGAILSFVVSIIIISLVYFREKKIILSIVFMLSVFLIGIFGHSVTRVKFVDAVSQVSDYLSGSGPEQLRSQELRLEMWLSSFLAISEDPLLIRGSKRLQNMFSEEISRGVVSSQISTFPHVHNEYLQAWLSRGPLGFLGVVMLLLLPLLTNPKSDVRVVAVSLSCVFSLCAMTNVPLLHIYSLRFYIFCMVLLLAIDKSHSKNLIRSV